MYIILTYICKWAVCAPLRPYRKLLSWNQMGHCHPHFLSTTSFYTVLLLITAAKVQLCKDLTSLKGMCSTTWCWNCELPSKWNLENLKQSVGPMSLQHHPRGLGAYGNLALKTFSSQHAYLLIGPPGCIVFSSIAKPSCNPSSTRHSGIFQFHVLFNNALVYLLNVHISLGTCVFTEIDS